jgi:hypothetical protein
VAVSQSGEPEPSGTLLIPGQGANLTESVSGPQEIEMSLTLIDGIKAVSLHNNIVRIDCISIGPNNEERPSGTLVIPAIRAGQIVHALTQALQDLGNKLREHQQQNPPTAGNA